LSTTATSPGPRRSDHGYTRQFDEAHATTTPTAGTSPTPGALLVDFGTPYRIDDRRGVEVLRREVLPQLRLA
jgi:hypothetical protein